MPRLPGTPMGRRRQTPPANAEFRQNLQSPRAPQTWETLRSAPSPCWDSGNGTCSLRGSVFGLHLSPQTRGQAEVERRTTNT